MRGTPQGQSVPLWKVHKVRVYNYGRYTTRAEYTTIGRYTTRSECTTMRGTPQGQSVQLWEVHHKVRMYNYGRYTTRSECITMGGTPQGQSVQLWEVHQTVRVYHYGRYTTRLVLLWDIHYNVVWLECVFNGESGDVHCQHSWSTFFFFV